MKPFRAFLYVFSILIGFLAVSFFFQEVENPSHIQTETFVSKQEKKEETKAWLNVKQTSDSLFGSGFPDLQKTERINFTDTILIAETITETGKSGIIFPSGDTTLLYPFFQKLKNLHTTQIPLRIIYFGDSQIENDRITSTLRKHLQQKFGGAGIGLIAPDWLYNLSHSFSVERSENWNTKDFLDLKERFKNKSLVFKSTFLASGEEGWFKIKQIRSKENLDDYSQLKFFFHSNGKSDITAKTGGETIYKGTLDKTTGSGVLNFSFNFTPPSFELYFQSADSFEIAAFSLESQTGGIQVDNIALRGQSFPPFSKSDKQALKETARLINPGLCILHFGVNIAPHILQSYHHYQVQLVREIKEVQFLFPGVPILVIGISDMARKKGGEMVSYPNIKEIKMEQKKAARTCNCAFWDLEEFMGGTGSMVKWVNSDPRLGQKDYVHFTAKGAEKTGEQLHKLIITEYENYLSCTTTTE